MSALLEHAATPAAGVETHLRTSFGRALPPTSTPDCARTRSRTNARIPASKLRLRFDLAPQELRARHAPPLSNPLFKFALEFLQTVRHDKMSHRFRNAHEL